METFQLEQRAQPVHKVFKDLLGQQEQQDLQEQLVHKAYKEFKELRDLLALQVQRELQELMVQMERTEQMVRHGIQEQ